MFSARHRLAWHRGPVLWGGGCQNALKTLVMEKWTFNFSLNGRSAQAASMLGAQGIGRQPFNLLFSKLSNGTETLNRVREQWPYKLALYECYRNWERREAQSFHQPVYSEAKEDPGEVGDRAGSEEREKARRTKTAPESSWKLSQVQGAWNTPSPWEWSRFKQTGVNSRIQQLADVASTVTAMTQLLHKNMTKRDTEYPLHCTQI